MNIPNYHRRRIMRSEIAVDPVFPDALSVSQMILPGHQNPLPGQYGGQTLISFDIFRHTVHDLQDTDRFTLRYLFFCMNLRFTIS